MNQGPATQQQLLSSIFERAAYPGVLVAAVGSASWLLDRGVPAGMTSSIVFVATLMVVAALERAHPHVRAWNPPTKELQQDLLYLVLASVGQLAARLIGLSIAALVGLALVDWIGPRPWPQAWPGWARLAFAIALADLGKYWVHRLAHERAWLWHFHAEHHAPTRMHALNGVRLHPVNMLWNLVLDAGVPLVLGLEGRAVVLVAVLRGVVSVLQHANVALRLGPFDWILSTPNLHQWHHSSTLEEASSNYGSTLIVWDVLFGTRREPRRLRIRSSSPRSVAGSPASLGIAGDASRPARLRHQLVWPWCASRAPTCRSLRGWTPQ